MKERNSAVWCFLLGVFVIITLACTQKKETFPVKPIEVIIPWDAGGGTDVFVRNLSIGAKKHFGQPWTIVNRGGAGGVIATTEFLTKKNDGYSIIFEAVGVFSTQPKMNKVKYSMDDFIPIIGTTVDSIFLVTNKQSRITNATQLMEYLKNNTAKWGYTGKGSLHHIGWTAFFSQSKVKETGVSYDGGGDLIAALLGNHIQFASLHPVNMKGHKEEGNFIPLLILSQQRDSQYPDVPTAKELGIDLDFEVWKFFLAPKDTPKEVVDILAKGINEMLNDPEIRQNLIATGNIFLPQNDAEFIWKKLRNNVAQTGKILDDMGLSAK